MVTVCISQSAAVKVPIRFTTIFIKNYYLLVISSLLRILGTNIGPTLLCSMFFGGVICLRDTSKALHNLRLHDLDKILWLGSEIDDI